MKLPAPRLPRIQPVWWIGAALLLAAGAIAALVPAHDWSELLERSLEEKNLAAALLFFCAAYAIGTLLLLPAWIFPIAAGAAFGMGWGIAAAVVSSTLAALAAFLIGRHVVRDHVERAARRNDTFKAVDKAVKGDPFKVVLLLRLSPVLPSGLKSYFLGLTCAGPLAYTAASALGMLPGLVLKVYVGHAGRGVLDAGGPLKWALLAVGVAATVAVTLVVGRVARKRLGL